MLRVCVLTLLLVNPPLKLIELPLMVSAAVPVAKVMPETPNPAAKLLVKVAPVVFVNTHESPELGVTPPCQRALFKRLLLVLLVQVSVAAVALPRERSPRPKAAKAPLITLRRSVRPMSGSVIRLPMERLLLGCRLIQLEDWLVCMVEFHCEEAQFL